MSSSFLVFDPLILSDPLSYPQNSSQAEVICASQSLDVHWYSQGPGLLSLLFQEQTRLQGVQGRLVRFSTVALGLCFDADPFEVTIQSTCS